MLHDVSVEKAVLGQILLEADAYLNVCDIIKRPECFYDTRHQHVYKGVIYTNENGGDIDLITIKDALLKLGTWDKVGGYPFLTQMTDLIASAVHIRTHAQILWELYMRREVARVFTKGIEQANNLAIDPFNLVDNCGDRIMQLTNFGDKRLESVSLKEALQQRLLDIEEDRKNKLKTGIKSIDELTGGFPFTSMVVIAGATNTGKTSLAITMLISLAMRQRVPCYIFSMEMSKDEILERIVTGEFASNDKKLTSKNKQDKVLAFQQLIEQFDAPLYISDEMLWLEELRNKCRYAVKKYDIKCFFLDYVGLIKEQPRQRAESSFTNIIGKASTTIKNISKELRVPFVVLSQVNRQHTQRDGELIEIKDLSYSDKLSHDADIIMIIQTGNQVKQTYVQIAKNRHGKTDTLALLFDEETGLFKDRYSRERETEEEPPF